MRNKVLGLVVLLLALIFIGCSDDDTASDNSLVYAAGYYHPSDADIACYWVDGVVHPLTNVTSYAMDMVVVGSNNIYITGYLSDSGTDTAFLWVNGTMTILTDVNSRGLGLFVDSSDNVYVAGYCNTFTACYWKNGTATMLTNRWSKAFGIFVTNDTVYTAGCVDATGMGGIRARYWVNSTGVEISGDNGSIANDIIVHQGTVYVCGTKSPSALLWTDGVENPFLTGSSPGAQGKTLAIGEGSVYAGGDHFREGEDDVGYYWENGTAHYLPGTSQTVNDIAVHNGIVFSGGSHLLARACFWKNTTLYTLCEEYPSMVNAIHATDRE